MEFPELGKNCSWPPCKELDFLPLTCAHCKLIFCKDHHNTDRHECRAVGLYNTSQVSVETFICTSDGCKSYSAVEMLCPKCGKHFCLEHRYHTCFNICQEEIEEKKKILESRKQQFSDSLNAVNKMVNEGIKKSMLNPKKQEAAQRLNLMRLKGKAQGPAGVPTDNRIYFQVLFVQSAGKCSGKPVYISKDWSVGKVIDSISDLCNVQNNNNVANAKKLRLFKRLDGVQISSDMGMKINELINGNTIINGETLILEYIDPNEDLTSYQLKNFEEYNES